MKKRDVYISMGIVAAGVLAVLWYGYGRGSGYLKLECDGGRMELASGVFGVVNLRAEEGAAEVRARGYRVRSLEIRGKEGSNTWRLVGERPWGELEKIEVGRGETRVVECGPPFTVRADVGRTRDYVSLGYSVVGKAGEHYRRILKNGRQIEAPGVEIVDEKGAVLASGNFAYG